VIRQLTLLLFFAGALCAQQRFEIASVKPSKAEPGHSGFDFDTGRVAGQNVSLKACIMGAYEVGPNQITGGPDWLESDRFEILAKADGPARTPALREMLRTLLGERFKLALRTESRPMQAYVLEVAKNGPRLEKSEGNGSSTENKRGDINAGNITMDRLAHVLSRQMDLPVVNHTGLDGAFNLRLQWSPEYARNGEGTSIFAAIQEQLGLRLRSEKTPVEVLVIDHAERPAEN
jgi:uncharacterized protein (TIGR03435 family)